MLNPPAPSEDLPLEEERLAVLRRYKILGTPATPVFDRLAELAAHVFSVPYVGINFVDRDHLWFKACVGLPLTSLPRAGSLCECVLSDGDVFFVADAAQDVRFRDDPLVVHPPGLRFYAGAPLRTPDGFIIGVLCLADVVARPLSSDSRALLAQLADVVMREVEMHQTQAELEAHIIQRTAALEHANQELRAQGAERKEAQRRLEESRQRYRSLFEQNNDAVYSFNQEGRFLSANAACEALSGYSRQDLLQMSFRELIVQEDVNRALGMFEKALRGEAQHDEIVIIHRDGHRVEISVSKMPIVVGGNVVGVYGISRDVTARKALERERERLLTEAIERAERDPLTGLLNHRAFHKRFRDGLARAQQAGQPLTVALLDLNDFHFFNDVYGHIAGDDVLRRVAETLQEMSEPGANVVLARYGGDEFALLQPWGSQAETEALAQSLAARLDALEYSPPGYPSTIPLTLSIGAACFPEDGMTRLDILGIAEARLRRAKSGGDAQAERLRAALARSVEGFTMLDALVTAVDSKDGYTRRHSEDVLVHCAEIARALGLDEKTQQVVAAAALLHDIGKIGVPDVILRKPGRLTDDEFQAIRQHPQMGAVIVQAVPGFEEMLDAIRHHHERWDGGGYPFGLRGAETPLIARLMAVADAYSAMTTDRPYRKGMSAAQAQAVLAQGTGTQWDPQCVAAFLKARQS